MEDTSAFLKRAAERCGFTRDFFVERNIPTNRDNIVVVHFFGDLRSQFVFSSLLLNRYREELRGSKYMILCTWKGHRHLFPYVDEVWSPDVGSHASLYREALGMENHSEAYTTQRQNLNYFFANLITPEDVKEFYNNGLTTRFHERLGTVKRFLPMVPSASYLDAYFNQEIINRPGFKVLIMPTKHGRGVITGQLKNLRARREFYAALLDRLCRSGYCPVVVQNYTTLDLSSGFSDRCIFVREDDMGKIAGMMRATGLVLDLFNGTSRLAIAARTPFLAVDERGRFAHEREYEVDDLCAADLPKQYIFSFPTIIEGGDPAAWNGSLFDNIVAKLNHFLPSIDRNTLPATSESTAEVPFAVVRERKSKRIGTKYVKIPRD